MKNLIRKLVGESFYLRMHRWLRKGGGTREAKENAESVRRADFYSGFVGKGELCFDVGANIGNRVGPLLGIGAKVVAIEPQEHCYTVLKNKYHDRIELVTDGMGEREGVKDFYVSNAHTISSFSEEFVASVKDGRFKEHTWNAPIPVKITTLDALIKKYGRPAFIKIDVEGYELEVLKGLSVPIKMISFEYMVPEQTDKIVACIEQIESNGGNVEYNYCIGETMAFVLDNWLTPAKMKEHVWEEPFTDTQFGDVYCRLKA